MCASIKAAFLLTVVLLSSGCATGSHAISVHGRAASVTRQPPGGPKTVVEGELIAIDDGRVWILGKGGLSEVPRAEVTRMRLKRHELTRGRGLRWALVGAVITGGALTLSCASVDNGGCGVLLPAVAVPWLLTGLAGGPSLDASSRMSLRPPRLDEARPYSRFPQGLPPGFQGPPEPTPSPGSRR